METLEGVTIAFIGGGTMGEALVQSLLHRGVRPQQIVVSEPLAARREYFVHSVGVRATALNREAVDGAQVVVLAIKPQVLSRVLEELHGYLHPDALALSIVAGASIQTIRKGLGIEAIARVMPNTPGQIGEGISVWTVTSETTDTQRRYAQAIVSALGEEIYVESESYLDMATALSGSGPAYVFMFIEALADAGVHMGFPRQIAEQLALQTVRGAAIYAQRTGLHPAVLRNQVTSPGGTTAEALYALEEGAFRGLVVRAVLRAYEKAKHLGAQESK